MQIHRDHARKHLRSRFFCKREDRRMRSVRKVRCVCSRQGESSLLAAYFIILYHWVCVCVCE
jgi:hypothetical protein